MLGLLLIIGMCIAMSRVAEEDGKSGFMWGAITFVICFVCSLVIPLPMLNILIGGVITFVVMAATSKT